MPVVNDIPEVLVRRNKHGVALSVEVDGVELRHILSVNSNNDARELPTVTLTAMGKVVYEEVEDGERT